ncbi:hypothetical protein HETIRDRAFT_312412 [Heterobasidion irregulare TC 32-1]|uniref:C2H2-type domain-containing protein n=1 Tax=Heterobasidion irregulare (strain TC 32-1) TaxID=747525 RepID=W4KCV6_HETIT|nr:uncharacterized protein HETIRDRAFT_312412 [Heterobasidion irregulare TC 32-1]ETW83574.1 hypothetical protein HETIRDRAFT_312412 [Heterobasidion irregulare TC 32-1]
MFDLDELMKTIFQELRDGVSFLDSDGPLDMTDFDDFPDAPNVGNTSHTVDETTTTGAELVPAEGTKEEADLIRMLEENGLLVNTDRPNLNYCNDQGSLAQRTLIAMPFAETFVPDGSGSLPEVAMMSQSIQQSKSIDVCYNLWCPPAHRPFAMDNDAVPLPPISHRKRRAEDDATEWFTSKSGRRDGMSVVERIPPPTLPQTSFSRFATAYEATEGNALRNNKKTTRTFGGEEILFAADSVPVAVPLLIQEPWPTMTSTAAPATHPYHPQASYMTAGYSGQAFPHSLSSFGAQPTFQQAVPMLPWGAASESRQRFDTMPHIPTGNGVYFPQPPFGTTGPSMIHDTSLRWMASAQAEDPFLLRTMPSMPVESSLDASLAQTLPSYPSRMREPHRVLHTSATEPQTFTFPVAAPTFGAVPCPSDDRLPSVANPSQTVSSSTSSTAPSAAKPKRKKQPPRASGMTSSSKIPSTSKPKKQKQPPRASDTTSSSNMPSTSKPKKKKQPPRASGTTSKAPSTSKPKRKKQAPAQTSGSSSSTAPSCVGPIKRRRPPQTPYDPDGVGCHICKGGFTRPSEVTKHLRTKKHRLNELAMMFPGLKMSQPKNDIICPIDKCDEVAVESWLMKQHLEEKHGLIAKNVSATNVNDADVEKGDDVDTDEDESD